MTPAVEVPRRGGRGPRKECPCGKPAHAKGLCTTCHYRAHRHEEADKRLARLCREELYTLFRRHWLEVAYQRERLGLPPPKPLPWPDADELTFSEREEADASH